eukprot:2200942-Rhodomonas_salina.1
MSQVNSAIHLRRATLSDARYAMLSSDVQDWSDCLRGARTELPYRFLLSPMRALWDVRRTRSGAEAAAEREGEREREEREERGGRRKGGGGGGGGHLRLRVGVKRRPRQGGSVHGGGGGGAWEEEEEQRGKSQEEENVEEEEEEGEGKRGGRGRMWLRRRACVPMNQGTRTRLWLKASGIREHGLGCGLRHPESGNTDKAVASGIREHGLGCGLRHQESGNTDKAVARLTLYALRSPRCIPFKATHAAQARTGTHADLHTGHAHAHAHAHAHTAH